MTKLSDCPLRVVVALRAIGSEEADMLVFGLVAGGTIKQPFLGLELRVLKIATAFSVREPLFELLRLHGMRTICFRVVLRVFPSDLRQRGVIHFGNACDAALMLGVARDAGADLLVKRGRLTLQQRLIVSVAHNAVLRLDAFAGRVAGRAVILEKGVRL